MILMMCNFNVSYNPIIGIDSYDNSNLFYIIQICSFVCGI